MLYFYHDFNRITPTPFSAFPFYFLSFMLSLTWGVSKGIKREGFCLRIQLPWVYKPLALKGFSMGGETRGIESPHATHDKQFQQSGESENLNDRHSQLIDGCFMRICESSQIRAV